MKTSKIEDIAVEISGLEHRLLARINGRLSGNLQFFDKEPKGNKQKNKDELEIKEEMIESLIHRVVIGVLRQMEDAVIAVLEKSYRSEKKIAADVTKQMIDKFVNNISHEASVGHILKVVCDFFQVSIDEMHSRSRIQNVALARQTSMYFVKKYTELTLEKVGRLCGNRNHATVKYACEEIEKLKTEDKTFRDRIAAIDKILQKTLNKL